ncbi:CopG family transcriptional regulator [Xanthobacter oligotrophicus]|uniref:CopG family transcriptional regulator n=1 Tax=Xanthobacter oligotrophicus TaxID=2607286 RepID=UPI0011F2DE2E|nr:CopG family transcriptional regulator [Xanthobacter oligotrophicus]MCG5233831.1 CopG family transcriptional regulator [Xanthobacter oligotrophicus]
MAGRKKKAQISVYLEPDIMDLLAHYAAQRDQSMSLIAQAAIASFLSPDSAERQEAALARRLGQIDRRLARLERDLSISTEAFATFIRFWLATTPALPEPAAQAARAKVSERYAAYTSALGRRLAKGPQLRQEIEEDVTGPMINEGGRS